MSQFSDKLGFYIDRARLTEQQLARVSGFNRSYIALMKSGLRISPNTEKTSKLIAALNLTPYEREELWADYMRAKFGDDTYELRKQMLSLIRSFGSVPSLSIRSMASHEIPDVGTVNGRVNVESMIKAVLEKEASREQGFLRLILQPVEESVLSLIQSVLVASPRLQIEQIIGLEQDISELSGKLYNLKAFQWIVRLMTASRTGGYRACYYYDRIQAHFNSGTLFPFLILASDYALLLSLDLEYAMVFHQQDQISLLLKVFEGQKQSCTKIGVSVQEYRRLLKFRLPVIPDTGKMYFMGSQPYLTLAASPSMVQKYLSSDPEMRDDALRILNKESLLFSRGVPAVLYFTREGLKRFMETGAVDILGQEIRFEKADRRRLLDRLIHMAEDGAVRPYLLDEALLEYPKELIVAAYDRKQINVLYMPDQPELRMGIEEHTLQEMIYSFLETLESSQYVLSVHETLKILKKV